MRDSTPAAACDAPAPGWPLPGRAQVALVLTLACFYLLIGSRERPWADATPVYEVAESLVRDGDVSIKTAWPIDLPPGRGGRTYAAAPLAQSLVHVPGAALRQALLAWWPDGAALTLPFAAHLGPALLGALLGLVFLRLLRQLGVARARALGATLALATCTTVLVYARSPYSEILQALAFTWMLGLLLRLGDAPTRRDASWLGAAAGLLVATKLVFAVCLPGVALYLAWRWRAWRWRHATPGWPGIARMTARAVAGALPFVILVLAYNKLRWGDLFSDGYAVSARVFAERAGVGLWGMFLSPGKSVFLYSPPLVLSLLALPHTLRTRPHLLAALAVTVTPPLVVYARFLFWSGDYAWGPRYLVFAVPALALPGALWLADRWAALADRRARALAGGALALLLLAGLRVQVLGSALYWDHFIRVAIEARAAWLGWPNKEGAPVEPVAGICGACFEDVHPIQWLPPFSPIEGHAWLARHVLRGDDARTALQDAPWRRYTRAPTPIDHTYPRARIDWWYLDAREHTAGHVLLGLLAAGAMAGAWGARRGFR